MKDLKPNVQFITISIVLENESNNILEIEACNNWTVARLKYKLFYENLIDVDGFIFFKGERLMDHNKTLYDIGIGEESIVNVVKSCPKKIGFGQFLTRYTPLLFCAGLSVGVGHYVGSKV